MFFFFPCLLTISHFRGGAGHGGLGLRVYKDPEFSDLLPINLPPGLQFTPEPEVLDYIDEYNNYAGEWGAAGAGAGTAASIARV